MVISMVKLKWILFLLCPKCFYNGLHMTLECRDTKLWHVSGVHHKCLYHEGQSQSNGPAHRIRSVVAMEIAASRVNLEGTHLLIRHADYRLTDCLPKQTMNILQTCPLFLWAFNRERERERERETAL
jgi:hypothetical protein